MRDTIVHLPDSYEMFVCENRDHDCYGRIVQSVKGKWNGHIVYIEKVAENWFNFWVDKEPLQFKKNYDFLVSYLKEKIL